MKTIRQCGTLQGADAFCMWLNGNGFHAVVTDQGTGALHLYYATKTGIRVQVPDEEEAAVLEFIHANTDENMPNS